MKRYFLIALAIIVILFVFSSMSWRLFLWLLLVELLVYLLIYFKGKTDKEFTNEYSKKQHDYFKGEYDFKGKKKQSSWVEMFDIDNRKN